MTVRSLQRFRLKSTVSCEEAAPPDASHGAYKELIYAAKRAEQQVANRLAQKVRFIPRENLPVN